MAASTSTGTRADGGRPGAPAADIRAAHGRMYRPQKHIYDLTRSYYLLGRDRLIAELDAAARPDAARHRLRHRPQPRADRPALPGGSAVRPGRGRADAGDRRREAAARRRARDPGPRGRRSTSTRRPCSATRAASTTSRSPTACRWSTTPRPPLRAAVRHLAPGGTLHVVDFGDMAGLPGWFRRAMAAWLAKFHVRHRPRGGGHAAASWPTSGRAGSSWPR